MTAHNAVLCLMTDLNEEGELGFDADIVAAVESFKQAWEPQLENR